MTTLPPSNPTISNTENVRAAATLDRVARTGGSPEFATIAEIATRLRVSKMTVYRLIHSGDLPGAIRVGRSFRVPSSAVNAYVAGSVITPIRVPWSAATTTGECNRCLLQFEEGDPVRATEDGWECCGEDDA